MTISPSAAPTTGHIPAIDGVRGMAVLLVTIAHTILMRPGCALDEHAAAIFGIGWCGVDLFFVLSGFLITGILYDAKGGEHYFTSFYIRRILRIFPVYYLAVFLLLVVLPRIGIPQADAYRIIAEDQGWFWLHLSNIHFARTGFTGDATDVFWSLAIEEQFYLLWPFAVWWLRRRSLLVICTTLIFTAFAARIALFMADIQPVAIYVLPFTRMDGLAAGGLIALVARGPAGLTPWMPLARRIALFSFAALLAIALICGGLPIWGMWTQLLGYSLFVALFASIVTLVMSSEPRAWFRSLFDRSVLRLFGRYSYAIYIGHLPVRMALRTLGFDVHRFPTIAGSSLPGQLLFTASVVLLSLLLAMMSWHLVEKHALRLKRFFPYHGRNAASPAPQLSSVAPSATCPVAAIGH